MKWTRLLALFGVVAISSLSAACSDDDLVQADPVPGPPTVSISAVGQTLTVSWNAVTGATSYDVTVSASGEADQTAAGVTDTQTSFSSLTPATTYLATVVARNSAGAGVAGTALGETDAEPETVVQVVGDVLTNTTWTSDKTYVLNQPTFVGVDCGTDGTKAGCVQAVLTIEPGTTIVGRTDVPQGVRGAYLVVSRGSQIIADATGGADRAPTEAETIVFTSDKPRGQRAAEDWGGIIINGMAPTNSGDEATGEGDSGLYGGTDPLDSSGILRGVRIEFAGDDVTPADQLNGLAIQGVGSGTTISYLQIHYNKDDGIEPFGGTVSVDHLVVSAIGDDSVDGTDGYRGFMQFIIGQQRGADADNGLELSNNGDTGNATPQSTAVVANATMIGGNTARVGGGDIGGAESDDAVQLREGSNYRVYNSIFTGFGDSGLCIRDAQTIVNANNRLAGQTTPTTTVAFENNIMWNNGGAGNDPGNFNACGGGSTTALNTNFFNAFSNVLADPGFDASVFNAGSAGSPPNFTVAAMPAGYTAFDVSTIAFDAATLFAPGDGRTLVATSYAGAIAPGAAGWHEGWTVWATDGSDSRPNQDGN